MAWSCQSLNMRGSADTTCCHQHVAAILNSGLGKHIEVVASISMQRGGWVDPRPLPGSFQMGNNTQKTSHPQSIVSCACCQCACGVRGGQSSGRTCSHCWRSATATPRTESHFSACMLSSVKSRCCSTAMSATMRCCAAKISHVLARPPRLVALSISDATTISSLPRRLRANPAAPH